MDIKADVRDTVIYYLQQDLDGDELLMKGVWEHCETDQDMKDAKAEIRRIIGLLKKGG